MAANSAEELKTSIQQAKENAQSAADDAEEERLTLKQALDTKLETERQKTTDAMRAAMDAEEKLADEIKNKRDEGG